MKRLCGLLCALFGTAALGAGCAAQDYNGSLGPALRDWRGDNMELRGFADQPVKPIRPAY